MQKHILYSWNSIALNPDSSQSDKFLDLSSLSIEDALTVAYPELSYCELIEVLKKLKASITVNEMALFAQYGFALDSKLQRLNEVVSTTPPRFWQWCLHHHISPRDLFPLLSLSSPQALAHSLEKFYDLMLSRSTGAQILELLVECFLIGQSDIFLVSLPDNAPTSLQPSDHWLQNLKLLRFPQTLKADSEKQKYLLSLPWTKELQTRWLRQGDRSGVEVKFFAANSKELQKHVAQLNKIIDQEKTPYEAP
jgi:hypothetical protein